MALTLSGTSGIVGAGIGTIGPSGANVTGVGTFTSVVSSGAISGTTGTYTGNVDIADKIVHTGDTDTAIRFSGADVITAETGGSERFKIDSTGNLSIGGCAVNTFSNYRTLTIGGSGSSSGSGIDLEKSDGTIYGRIFADTNGLQIGAPATGDYIRFETEGGTERVRIANNGDIEVKAGDVDIETSGKGIQFPNSYLTETSVNMHLNIAAGNNDFYVQSGGTTFAAFKGLSKDLQLTSGNLVIGTSGKGIDFSATSDGGSSVSELLDDYEEGTANATFKGADGGSTSLSNAIRYTKIGNLVHVVFAANDFSNNGVGGLLEIGMPFTSSNAFGIAEWHGGDIYWYPSSKWDTYTNHTGFNPYISANNAFCKLRVKMVDQDRQTTMSASNNNQISGASGLYCRFSITYTAA